MEEEDLALAIPQIDMLRAIAVPFPGDLLPAPTNSKETGTAASPETIASPEVGPDYANLSREEKLQAILGNLKRHHDQVRCNILAQALRRKEQIESSSYAESWLHNEKLEASEGRSGRDAMDWDMDEPGPEQDEARRQEEAIVKCLKTVWDPSKPIPHLPSSMTTAAPGSAPLDSSGRKQSQPSERHVELVQDTINMLESYGEQAEEGLVYYRRAMERLAGTSISTNAGANNSAGTTPTATSPVTGAFFSRSSAFSESARGNAVGSPGTRNTAGASTAETPRRDSGAARGISAVANEYDASRDPRLKR